MTYTFAQFPCVALAEGGGLSTAALVAILVAVFFAANSKKRAKFPAACRDGHDRHRACGGFPKWIVVVAIVFGALVAGGFLFATSERAARHAAIPQAVRIETTRTDGHAELLKQASMHDAWNELHKSRIDLRMEDGSTKSITIPISQESTDSLTRSIQRVEAAAERVTKVADQMMDIGTLVGRALAAVNGSLGASSSAAVQAKAAAEVKSAVAALPAAAARPQVDVEWDTPPKPADSPAWIDDPPKHVGSVWREVLVTDEFATDEECRHQADGLLLKATYDYIRQMAGNPGDFVDSRRTETWSSESPVYPTLTRMGIGIDYIRREIGKEEFTETVQRSFGPMRKNYTLVEFSPSVQGELRQRWEEYLRKERFAAVGLSAGSVLGLVGLAFGLLKVDTWTKGYYSKRLFLGVPAAIIGAVVALLTWKEVIF